MRHLQDSVENVLPEFLAYALLEHFTRVAVPNAILDYVVKDSSDNCVLVAPVTRQNHRNVCRMRQVGKLCPFPHLPVMMLRGKRKGVIDRVGVSVHSRQAAR